jgi:hypothetical protein
LQTRVQRSRHRTVTAELAKEFGEFNRYSLTRARNRKGRGVKVAQTARKEAPELVLILLLFRNKSAHANYS